MIGTVCDKCKLAVTVQGCETKISDEVFGFKITTVDLCINCTKDFVNWLKGETIPKQTKFPTFNISQKETKP